MEANDPGLFDLPEDEPSVPAVRVQRGRNRETWTLTATAKVVITDASALQHAAARAEQDSLTVGLDADLDAEDGETEALTSEPIEDAFEALGWLIWPTEGMDDVLEADAFRVLEVESKINADSVDRGTATWSATIKLTDVEALRRVAVRGHPEEAEAISNSLAVAWQRAADPFAPLRAIPGITWEPGPVIVEHVPARTAGSR